MGARTDDEFIAEHRDFVRSIALRVQHQFDLNEDLDELIASGFEGLLDARRRYDPSRGVKLTTFAYYRVRGAILDGVRRMAYLPRKAHAQRKAAEALDWAAEDVGDQRAPGGPVDVADTLRRMDDILTKTSAAYTISIVGQSEDDAPPGAEERLITRELRARVRDALCVLDDRERRLVVGYYFEDRTLDEIGAEMGISKSWASRICTRALGRMRDALESD